MQEELCHSDATWQKRVKATPQGKHDLDRADHGVDCEDHGVHCAGHDLGRADH